MKMTTKRWLLSMAMRGRPCWIDKKNRRLIWQEDWDNKVNDGQPCYAYYTREKRIIIEQPDLGHWIHIPHIGRGYVEREFCEKHWEYLKEKGYDAILWPYMQASYPRLVEYDTDQKLTRLGLDFTSEFLILRETDDKLDDLCDKDTTFRQIVDEWVDQQGIQVVGEYDW